MCRCVFSFIIPILNQFKPKMFVLFAWPVDRLFFLPYDWLVCLVVYVCVCMVGWMDCCCSTNHPTTQPENDQLANIINMTTIMMLMAKGSSIMDQTYWLVHTHTSITEEKMLLNRNEIFCSNWFECCQPEYASLRVLKIDMRRLQ